MLAPMPSPRMRTAASVYAAILAHHAERKARVLRQHAEVFARRHADDIGDGGPPHAKDAHAALALDRGGALFAERLFHVVAKLAAEIERQNAQQPAVKAVAERFLCTGHCPSQTRQARRPVLLSRFERLQQPLIARPRQQFLHPHGLDDGHLAPRVGQAVIAPPLVVVFHRPVARFHDQPLGQQPLDNSVERSRARAALRRRSALPLPSRSRIHACRHRPA